MDFKNIKILIIDDVKDNIITLSALVREFFPTAIISTALSGENGIQIATTKDPDLILLDILMPGMDGYEVCKILKENPLTNEIPVVFVTALRGNKENNIKALSVGADAFITKPVDETELVAQIRAMVKIRKASIDKKTEKERLQQLVEEKTRELLIQNEITKAILDDLKVEYEKRVQSDQARENSELKYKTLFDKMHDGFSIHEMIYDQKGNPINYKFLDVNSAFENITGLKASDIIGKKVLDILPTIEHLWIENYGNLVLTGDPIDFESYSAALGKYFKVSAFKTDENQFATLFVDVTNRKIALDNIQKNATWLQGMVKILQYKTSNIQEFLDYAIEEAIKLTESDLGYLYLYDEKNEELSMKTCSEEVKKHCSVFLKEDRIILHKSGIWNQVIQYKKEVIINDFKGDQPDLQGFPEGHIPISRFLAIPINSGENIVAVVGFANKKNDYDDEDVLQLKLLMDGVWREVERMKVSEYLQKSDERYETFINANEDIIFLKDENFKYVILNDACAKFFNLPKQEMIGKTDQELASETLISPCNSSDINTLKTLSTIVVEEKLGDSFYETTKFPVNIDNNRIGVGAILRNITDSKKTAAREQFISGITAAVSDAIVATDSSFNIIYINQRAEDLYGYKIAEVIGKHPNMVYAVDDIPALELEIKNIITNGETYIGEFLQKKKDGTIFMAEMKAQPMFDDSGTLLAYIGIQRDITLRKKNEEQLIEQKQEYMNLANSGVALVYRTDTNKLFTYFNEPFLNFTGRSLEEEIGEGWFKDVHTEDFSKCYEIFSDSFDKKIPFELEYRLRHKCGDYKWIRDLSTPIYDSKGIFLGYIGQAFDITDRKKNELVQEIQLQIARSIQEVQKVENLLEVIHLELSKIFDSENFFVALYNEEKDMMMNVINRDELDSLEEWPAKDSLAAVVAKRKVSMLMTKQDIVKFTKKHKMNLIGSLPEIWLGVPVEVQNSRSGAMVVQNYNDPNAYSISDLTLLEMIAHEVSLFIEKKRILEELVASKEVAEESDRLKSAFLANMSHEIRTPMNGILGFSALLKEPNLSGELQKEYINIIEKSGLRMLNIINDIVDISKIESGLMKVNIILSNVNDHIDYICNFFRPEVESKGMNLILKNRLPDHLAYLLTDKEKLFAILTNLVKNAIKYSNKGTIEIGYHLRDKKLEFYVHDTGIGIAKERLIPIFERFIQADITDVLARQGAGLGLAITKAYVEMLGGEIWVDSTVGVGSTFYFTLPYKEDYQTHKNNTDITSEVVTTESEKIGKLNILIAEDEEFSTIILIKALKNYTKNLFQAKSGAKAIEIMRDHPEIDLVLMDIRLIEMNGYEATKQIRLMNEKVIIIAQTAYTLSGDKERALAVGCNDYIAKPIRKNELIAVISKYF